MGLDSGMPVSEEAVEEGAYSFFSLRAFPFLLGGSEISFWSQPSKHGGNEEGLPYCFPRFLENQFSVPLPCSTGASLHVSFLHCKVG